MIKCDFCAYSKYVEGKVVCKGDPEGGGGYCDKAIQTFAQVMKEDYRSRNSKNINKNFNYNKGTRR